MRNRDRVAWQSRFAGENPDMAVRIMKKYLKEAN